ncbi:MAG: hypothetical protein N2447_02235 [Thermoanaerobaculum sp.]|nr:hypothetical protein [Thermoanaerobaculum sp.]
MGPSWSTHLFLVVLPLTFALASLVLFTLGGREEEIPRGSPQNPQAGVDGASNTQPPGVA